MLDTTPLFFAVKQQPAAWPAPAEGPPAGWVEGTVPGKRPLTWVILGWNALMFAWICYGIVRAGGAMNDCVTEAYSDACEAGTTIGTGIAIGAILFLTAAVDVILGVIWTVTKKD